MPGRVNSLAPGRRVISSLIHSIVNVLDHGMGPQQALNTPRLHCEGGKTEIDVRVGDARIAALQQLGHDVQPLEETFSSTFFGRPNGIVIDEKSGRLLAGVNQLKPAQAIGL